MIIMKPWMDYAIHYAIVRLSSLIREEESKQARLSGAKRATAIAPAAKETNESGALERDIEQFENDENQSNANGSPRVVTDKSRTQESNSNALLGQQQRKANN